MGVPVEFCAPWTTPDKLCCPDVEAVDCETGLPVVATYAWSDLELIDAASSILFRATCRQYPGHCQVTIRPCVSCNCRRSPCSCSARYPFIDLQERYPVVSVDEVLLDGAVFTEWRLDDYHRLVRTDGGCWPSCNDLIEPSTQPNTIEVTYTAGRLPPIELQIAAAELACEMKRACNGGDCKFPRNVTSVSRQGVTMNVAAVEAAVGVFGTGLAFVDATVSQYDCRRSRSRVYHPSIGKPRQVYPNP